MIAALWFVVELLACALALFSAWIVARFAVVAFFCAVACVSAFMAWTLGERRAGR